MKSAGKARSNGLYRHIRTSKEIIRNLLNDYEKNFKILEEVKNNLLIEESISYPQMKIIDMLFWQIGVDLNDTSK